MNQRALLWPAAWALVGGGVGLWFAGPLLLGRLRGLARLCWSGGSPEEALAAAVTVVALGVTLPLLAAGAALGAGGALRRRWLAGRPARAAAPNAGWLLLPAATLLTGPLATLVAQPVDPTSDAVVQLLGLVLLAGAVVAAVDAVRELLGELRHP